LRGRLSGDFTRPLPDAFSAPLAGLTALEVGGPSALFGEGGLLPVYPLLERVDGVQFSAQTFWHGEMDAGPYAVPGARTGGQLWIADGATLDGVPDGSYDAVISSHVVEHLANPLAALARWRAVCRPGALLLTVAPHKQGTFDHRRPVTTLEHLVADLEAGTGEDDLTHLGETLALHDLRRDIPMNRAEFETARRDNVNTRLIHHHVFTTPSLLALLDRAGVEVLEVEVRRPHDIYVLGRWSDAPDNAAVLAPGAPWRRASPFPADRQT
jgi:SAM-dependent methyltransferase